MPKITVVRRRCVLRPIFEVRVSVKGRVVFKCFYGSRASAEIAGASVASQYQAV